MVGPALIAVVGMGAVGGIIANVALTPLTAGASLLQSYWYGSGLILGERMMYTVHWEKIKGRLDKGEDFLQVLDKIMNDDITAIANLSFKAMDETGKLYLQKAGESISKFIENLLEAAINPFFSGTRTEADEPPPSGESTPTGIHLSIAEIESMTYNTLAFEVQSVNFQTKYTESTQLHMITILSKKQQARDETKEELVELEQLLADLRGNEQRFQELMFQEKGKSIENFYANFLTKLSSAVQKAALLHLDYARIKFIYTHRRATTQSDAQLKQMQQGLLTKRQQISRGSPNSTPQQVMEDVYGRHIAIFLWQEIYSL